MVGLGSSPRMRGALVGHALRLRKPRIIPADAGSTCRSNARRIDWKDHPRGCGEHLLEQCLQLEDVGSSPRMRGAHIQARGFIIYSRIIPADAGSTVTAPIIWESPADHPRGCGEHSADWTATHSHGGSSPRMRGALIPFCFRVFQIRIIPADAGSTGWKECEKNE